jgi:hypothetical protein
MATKKQIAAAAAAQKEVDKQLAATKAAAKVATTAVDKADVASRKMVLNTPYSASTLEQDNIAARRATEAYASPFSTAFGGSSPSTTLDYVRQYGSPFSDVFGGTGSSAMPYSPSQLTGPAPIDTSSGGKKDDDDGGGGGKNAPANDWTNQIYILINKLKSVGLPASTAERAGAFFASVLDDGITDLDNAVDIFLYSKTYKSKKTGQEIPSPYYTDFGKFNDGLSSAKPPGVLVPWVLGIRDTLKKYNPGSLYETDDAMQKYLKNDVKVSELDERFNAARLRSITADKAYVNALIELKFISKPEDLTGFFASPEIGQKQLELNRNTGALAAEALRRAKEGGIQLDTEFAKQQAAKLTAEGYSEAQIANEAARGFSRIARDIMPTVKISGIYQGPQAASASTIQKELQQEEFMGMDSERFNTLAGQESASFRGSTSFLNRTSLKSPDIGQI